MSEMAQIGFSVYGFSLGGDEVPETVEKAGPNRINTVTCRSLMQTFRVHVVFVGTFPHRSLSILISMHEFHVSELQSLK